MEPRWFWRTLVRPEEHQQVEANMDENGWSGNPSRDSGRSSTLAVLIPIQLIVFRQIKAQKH